MYICNQSILDSTFPDKCHIKMLEKHVHDSLRTYLTPYKLLHSTQSGFRPNHSCETTLLQMINKFLEAINNSQMIGMVMVDFRVDHTLLLKKLGHYKLLDKQLIGFLPICWTGSRKSSYIILNQELRMYCLVCPKGQSWVQCYF